MSSVQRDYSNFIQSVDQLDIQQDRLVDLIRNLNMANSVLSQLRDYAVQYNNEYRANARYHYNENQELVDDTTAVLEQAAKSVLLGQKTTLESIRDLFLTNDVILGFDAIPDIVSPTEVLLKDNAQTEYFYVRSVSFDGYKKCFGRLFFKGGLKVSLPFLSSNTYWRMIVEVNVSNLESNIILHVISTDTSSNTAIVRFGILSKDVYYESADISVQLSANPQGSDGYIVFSSDNTIVTNSFVATTTLPTVRQDRAAISSLSTGTLRYAAYFGTTVIPSQINISFPQSPDNPKQNIGAGAAILSAVNVNWDTLINSLPSLQ